MSQSVMDIVLAGIGAVRRWRGGGRDTTFHLLSDRATRTGSGVTAAFETAKRKGGVECRFYDARHTFVSSSRNPGVSVETIRQLAGRVNERCLSVMPTSAFKPAGTPSLLLKGN